MTPPRAQAADLADAYARLRPGGAGAAVAGRCGLLWVEGPDAAGFLQGLLSNDVAGLEAGRGCRALLLDAKGHLRAELRVHRDGPEAFTAVAAPALADVVAETFERYHFSEELELLGPEAADLVTVAGRDREDLAAAGLGIVVPGLVPGTADLVVDDAREAIARLGVPEAPAEALEMARVAAGAPLVGVDTGETTLVQEAGLEHAAVSFDKGCYLGQETVARAQFRGRVNRVLRGLLLPGPATPPAAVTRDGREVGRLTSAAVTPDLGPIGLAIMRREVEPGEAVDVAGVEGAARVASLPFGAP